METDSLEWSGIVTGAVVPFLELPLEIPEDHDYDRRRHALVSLELWLRTVHDRRAAADA